MIIFSAGSQFVQQFPTQYIAHFCLLFSHFGMSASKIILDVCISVIGIYGLIIAVILAESIPKPNVDTRANVYSIYTGMAHVSSDDGFLIICDESYPADFISAQK